MKSDPKQRMSDLLSGEAGCRSFGPVWVVVFSALVAVGIIVFLYGVLGENATRTWHAYLINYLFWFSLAFGMVLFGPVMNMTTADWARPSKRLSEALGPFLPLSLPMLWVIYPARQLIFSWIREPVPEKSFWLNTESMFIRDSVGLIVLSALALALIFYSIQGDRKVG